VYQQIRSDIGMTQDPVAKNFSLLQVALAQQPIKSFLAIPRRLPTEHIESLVPDEQLENLRELVSWVFGDPDRGQDRILTDSRLISSRLAPVIANEEALQHLRKYRDLEAAYEYSGGELEYLLRQLRRASRALKQALGVAPLHRDNEQVRVELRELETLLGALREQAEITEDKQK
jgi:hypothetical protein